MTLVNDFYGYAYSTFTPEKDNDISGEITVTYELLIYNRCCRDLSIDPILVREKRSRFSQWNRSIQICRYVYVCVCACFLRLRTKSGPGCISFFFYW